MQSTTESSVDYESVAPADKEAALQFSPKFEFPDDQDLSDDALLTLSPNVDTDFLVPVPEQLEESLPMTSPTITQNLFELTRRVRCSPLHHLKNLERHCSSDVLLTIAHSL